MDAVTIESYVMAIGETYESLLVRWFFLSARPWKVFEDDDQFSLDLEEGLSLTFHEGTRKLESVFITLIKTTPSTAEYKGELIRPFFPKMSQPEVHANFGKPMDSRGPIKMPKPMGMTGGWDSYQLDPANHPNIKMVFQYTTTLMVDTLVFTLLDKGHNYLVFS